MAFPVTLNGRTYTERDFAGFAYVKGLPDLMEDFATHAANVHAATSTSELTVGPGPKTLVIEPGKPWKAGANLRIARASDPVNTWMDAIVTGHSQGTGEMAVTVTAFAGSGTFTDWTVNVGGGGAIVAANPVPITQGGTGATTAGAARASLGAVGGPFGVNTTEINRLVLWNASDGTLVKNGPAIGPAGSVLTSNGPGQVPTFQTPVQTPMWRQVVRWSTAQGPLNITPSHNATLFAIDSGTGPVTVNLLSLTTAPAPFNIGFVKIGNDQNTVTINANGSDTIGRTASSAQFATPRGGLALVADKTATPHDWVRWDLSGTLYQRTEPGAVLRSLQDRARDYVSVKDFGAKGDGVADDTAAIQHAVNTISGRGTVLFPPGRYLITSAINIPPNAEVALVGTGRGATCIIVVGAINGFVCDNTHGLSLGLGITIRDLRIEGVSGALRGIYLKGGGTPGVLDARLQLITLCDLYVGGFTVHGISMEKCTSFMLNDIFPYGNAVAISLHNCGDGFIRGVKTGSNTSVGIDVVGGLGGAWDEGVNIYGCVLNVDAAGVRFKDMFYGWLVSCQVGSTANGAVQIDNAANIHIIGCEISNTQADGDGIVMMNAPERAMISANFIDNCRNYGIVVRGFDHTIQGNTFNGNGISGAGRDIHIDGARRCAIVGNRCGSNPVADHSIAEAGPADHNIIVANVCTKTISPAGANTVVANNLTSVP